MVAGATWNTAISADKTIAKSTKPMTSAPRIVHRTDSLPQLHLRLAKNKTPSGWANQGEPHSFSRTSRARSHGITASCSLQYWTKPTVHLSNRSAPYNTGTAGAQRTPFQVLRVVGDCFIKSSNRSQTDTTGYPRLGLSAAIPTYRWAVPRRRIALFVAVQQQEG